MKRYLMTRLLSSIPVLVVVSLIAFLLMQLIPGDPVSALYPIDDPTLSPADRQALIERTRESYGLDDPMPVQYAKWIGMVVKGDLGTSIQTKQPVTTMIKDRFPVTAQLSAMAMIVAVLIAIPAGTLAAVRRNSLLDLTVSTWSMAGIAVPNFFFGMLLILLFCYQLEWLPPPGNYVSLWSDPVRSLQLTVLPAAALGLGSASFLSRLVRSSLLEVLAHDYVRTARAKGLAGRVIVVRHGLRNSLLPVVTVLGLQFITLLGGTVIIEQIFALPGLGRMALTGIRSFDFPVIQGFVLFIGVVVVVGNLVVDLMYGALDPRIRY